MCRRRTPVHSPDVLSGLRSWLWSVSDMRDSVSPARRRIAGARLGTGDRRRRGDTHVEAQDTGRRRGRGRLAGGGWGSDCRSTDRLESAAQRSDRARDHGAPGGARGHRERQSHRGHPDAATGHPGPRGLGRLRGGRRWRPPGSTSLCSRSRPTSSSSRAGRVRTARPRPHGLSTATTARTGSGTPPTSPVTATSRRRPSRWTSPSPPRRPVPRTPAASPRTSGPSVIGQDRPAPARHLRLRPQGRERPGAGAIGAVIFNEGTIGAPDRNDVLIPTLVGYDVSHPGGRHRLRHRPRPRRPSRR